jgi:hypothetical protein
MSRGNVSDIFDRGALLAAAPIQMRWDDLPVVPLTAAPCIQPLSRWAGLPHLEGR